SLKPNDRRLSRTTYRLVGGRHDALSGARDEALRLGFAVHVIDTPTVGDATVAARQFVDDALSAARDLPRPACVLAAGETTVRVVGTGRGGRNQEFALAAAPRLASLGQSSAALASVATDGVDGPTDAAGALADSSTVERALRSGLGNGER